MDAGISKKGYFFAVDATIALFVLVLGTVLALAFYSYATPDKQVTFISNSMMEFMYSHQINDFNSEYIGPNRKLHKNENITDLDNPLIIQLGEFYYRNKSNNCGFCLGLINKTLRDVSGDFLAPGYSFQLYIENELVYNKSEKHPGNATVLIPSKTVISGVYNDTKLWGPYRVEVRSWR